MDDLVARVLTDPASPAAVALVNALTEELGADVPTMTSVDAPRLRALAVCLDAVAQYQPAGDRAKAKAAAAATDRLAGFLDWLGECAREGFAAW